MRMMIPVVRCDHCQNDTPPDVRSAIVEVTLPGQKSVRYSGENCDDCRSKFAQAITELVNEYLVEERKSPGRPAKVKPADDHRPGPAKGTNAPRSYQRSVEEYDDQGWSIADRTCKVCGHVSVTRGGLGQHYTSRHSTTLAEQGMLETREARAARFARIGRA